MFYALLYFGLGAASIWLDLHTGIRRPRIVVWFPLLVLDCAANWLMGQSPRNTMSGELWAHRTHPFWGRVQRAVDRMFFWQPDHCQRQWIKEAAHGGFWPALAFDWKQSK